MATHQGHFRKYVVWKTRQFSKEKCRKHKLTHCFGMAPSWHVRRWVLSPCGYLYTTTVSLTAVHIRIAVIVWPTLAEGAHVTLLSPTHGDDRWQSVRRGQSFATM